MAGQDVPDWTTKAVAFTFTPVTVTAFYSKRRTLNGTANANKVQAVAATGYTTLKFGVLILGTPTNAGKHIYIATGTVSTTSFAIPATSGSISFPFKKGKSIYLLGMATDHANVWAV